MSPMVKRVQSNARPRLGECAVPAFGLAGSEAIGGILGYRAEKWVRSMFLARMLFVHEWAVPGEKRKTYSSPTFTA